MAGFLSFLADTYDAVFAPANAFDSHSSAHEAELGRSSFSNDSVNSMSIDSGADWHNNFGTQADYQVPAESQNMFQSWDWSSSGSGIGSDWP